jgi:hypothetical protein
MNNLKTLLTTRLNVAILTVFLSVGMVACTQANLDTDPTITEAEVLAAQKAWGEGIVTIGNTFSDGGDYVKVEYSFSYTKDANGDLKIILHDSHVPFPG